MLMVALPQLIALPLVVVAVAAAVLIPGRGKTPTAPNAEQGQLPLGQAQSLGYTVVDASTVVATHLNQILYKHSHELIGHEEVQQLMQLLAKSSPKLAEELVPGVLSLSQLLKVLQALLAEQVPVRDIRSIAEAVANNAHKSQDTAALVAAVRVGTLRPQPAGLPQAGLHPRRAVPDQP